MHPVELDDEANGRVENEIQPDDFSGPVFAIESAIENSEDHEITERFVKLYGVKRPVQGNRRGEIGAEADTPGKIAGPSPATAGGETTEPPDRLADDDAGSESVHSLPDGQLLPVHVKDRDQQRDYETAVEDSGGLESLQREDLAGVMPVIGGIEEKHEQLSSGDAADGAVNR